ncbi:MAG TPA: Ig-like domain-containing protein [Jatrophihabitans sp.]
MAVSLISSSDNGSTYPTTLATRNQAVTLQRIATTIALPANTTVTPNSKGQVALRATVLPSTAPGTVTFLDSNAAVGAASVVSGAASVTVSLSQGVHTITASYAGDPGIYASSTTAAPQLITVLPPGGTLHPVAGVLLLDTRSGTGAPARAIGAYGSVTLQVTGRAGIPSSNVSAVALNVVAIGGKAGGYLIAYPAGAAHPVSSILNFARSQTVANLVTLRVGSGGRVVIQNHSATSMHIVANAEGWFGTPSTSMGPAGRYHAVTPLRLLDTRQGGVALRAGQVRAVQVTGRAWVPRPYLPTGSPLSRSTSRSPTRPSAVT